MKYCWLASYPKSGSTWVRFLIHNILFGVPGSIESVDELVPDGHQRNASFVPVGDKPCVIKAHSTWWNLQERVSGLRADGAILVVRHDRDACFRSNSNYWLLRNYVPDTDIDWQSVSDRHYQQCLKYDGDPEWLSVGFGTYTSHQQSWLNSPFRTQGKLLVVSLEQLVWCPTPVVLALAAYLGVTLSNEQVRSAIANTTIDRMRKYEEDAIVRRVVGTFYDPRNQAAYDLGMRFIRCRNQTKLPPVATYSTKIH